MNKKLYLVMDGEISGMIAWTQSAIMRIIPKKKDPFFKNNHSTMWEIRKENRERFVEFAVKCLEEITNPKEELYGYFELMRMLTNYMDCRIWALVLTDQDPLREVGRIGNG